MISIIIEYELSKYNLDGKWNDFVGVQKEVISVLKTENFFTKHNIVNHESGMIIRLTTRGIKETIGKGNRFQNLPKRVKQQKIATLRALPQLLEEGELLEDNVQNYHTQAGDQFAYFESKILIDNIVHSVRIAVRKKSNSNHFYIHHLDMQKDSELLSPSKKDG